MTFYRLFVFIILFLAGLFIASPDCVQSGEFAMDQSDKKTSFIVEADGYCYFSEEKTGKQLKLEAEMEAKRKAVEKAGVHVKSFSKMENFQLSYDIVQSLSEAEVRILEEKDFGIEDGKRYHVWIKASLDYNFKKKASDDNVFMDDVTLDVKVWNKKEVYGENEKLEVFVKGNKDFYLTLVYLDSAGGAVQLLPNIYRSDNFFKGGVTYTLPDKNDRFSFKIKEPFGNEKIAIYASTSKIKGREDRAFVTRGGYYTYDNEKQESIGDIYRGMIVTDEQKNNVADFYETTLQITTRKKKEDK